MARTTRDRGERRQEGAVRRIWCKAWAKEALAYNKGRKKYGVAAILGVTEEEGKGRLRLNLKTKRNTLQTHTYTQGGPTLPGFLPKDAGLDLVPGGGVSGAGYKPDQPPGPFLCTAMCGTHL